MTTNVGEMIIDNIVRRCLDGNLNTQQVEEIEQRCRKFFRIPSGITTRLYYPSYPASRLAAVDRNIRGPDDDWPSE